MPKLSDFISDEVLEQIKDELPEDAFEKDVEDVDFVPDDGSYVPRKRLNDKSEEIEALQSQLDEREEQINQLKEDTQATDELQDKIEQLQEKNKKQREELEQKLESQKRESHIDLALTEAKAKNTKAVKALLDTDEIVVDGDKVKGLESQLESIKDEHDYLFKEESDGTPDSSGGEFEGGSIAPENNPFAADNLNLQRQAEIVEESPNRARELIKEAGKDPAKYDL